jgi:hypothetical protein
MRITTALASLVGLLSLAKGAMPTSSEFTRWRMEYAEAPDALYSWAAETDRLAALETIKHDKLQFVGVATEWLKRCPIDARLRIMLASALSELGRSGETISHTYIYYGLLDSIVGDADGSSKEKAFRVVSIDEEYEVCDYLRARVLGQRNDGHFDVLTVILNEQKKELYFNASIVFRNENRSLQPKK